MQRELNRFVDQRIRVEVVNGGVLGYNFERVLKRIDEYLAIEPDLITIYLGWNRTIARADPRKHLYLYRNLALYRIFYHFVINKKNTGIETNYQTKTYFDKNDPNFEGFHNYSFKYDIKDLDTLIDKIKSNDERTKVIIITLAGLLDLRMPPDTSTLNMAYPISSTNNLYAFPLLTDKYNDELKEYAYEHQIDVIDFETYAFDNMAPRSTYWGDSVHLTNDGYLRMGKYFADEIREFVPLRKD